MMSKRIWAAVACGWLSLGSAAISQVPPQALSAPLPGRMGSETVTPQWLLQVRPDLSSYSPALGWIGDSTLLFYSAVPPKQKTPVIEILDANTGSRRALGQGWAPKSSPDGRWIAFVSSIEDGTRIAVMRLEDGNVREIAHLAENIEFYATLFWTPDSRNVLLAYRPSHVRSWVRNTVDTQSEPTAVDFDAPSAKAADMELWLHPVEAGDPRRVLQVSGRVFNIEWFPEGNELLYSAVRYSHEGLGQQSTTVLGRFDLDSGAHHEMLRLGGAMQDLVPKISPDGRSIAMTLDLDNDDYDFLRSVVIFPASGRRNSELRRLTHEANMQRIVGWSSDGSALLVTRKYGPYSQLYRVATDTGSIQQLTRQAADLDGAAIGMGGRQIALLTQDAHVRSAVAVARLNAKGAMKQPKEVAEIVPPPENRRLGEVREVAWTSVDGIESRGALFLPPDYRAGRRLPLVVDLHGGLFGATVQIDGGALLYNTPLEFHMWAAKGYAVLLPEFRSSGSLGLKGLRRMRDERDLYGFHGDEKDILGGIDRLIADGIVDADRVAVMGVSGGASETNWLVARTRNRFRAAVSCDGFAEIYMLLGIGVAAGGSGSGLYRRAGGGPWQVPEVYRENSAIEHVLGATTPTLFLMGSTELSGADPAMSSQFLYTALKNQGVDTRYIRYAHEGHGLMRPANLHDSLQRAIEWIDRHTQERPSVAAH